MAAREQILHDRIKELEMENDALKESRIRIATDYVCAMDAAGITDTLNNSDADALIAQVKHDAIICVADSVSHIDKYGEARVYVCDLKYAAEKLLSKEQAQC